MSRLAARKLDLDEIDKIIKRKLEWIIDAAQPKRIILFGSAATGEMTEASDVDLIVIFESDDELKASKELIFRSRPKDDWPQDLLLHTELSFQNSVAKGGGACWLAEREGKIIYLREKS